MYIPSSREWMMEGEHYTGGPSDEAESSWAWSSSATYTSDTAALQVLNNNRARGNGPESASTRVRTFAGMSSAIDLLTARRAAL